MRQAMAGIVTGLALAGSGQAAVISAGAGSGADAYIQLGSPTATLGATDPNNLTIKYDGSDTGTINRKVYIRFDTSSITQPVGDATLTLKVTLNNGGGSPTNDNPQNFTVSVFGLNDGSAAGGGVLGEDWAENAITWNNAPANIVSGTGAGNSVQLGTDPGQASLLGTFAVTSSNANGSFVTFSSQALADFLNADTNGMATLILVRTGWSSGGGTPSPNMASSNLIFASAETSGGPTLTYTPIPEPATMALLGLGVLGLVRRRA